MKNEKKVAVVFFLLTWIFPVSAAPSPWDSWRSGYTNFEQGETRREQGNYTGALNSFEKARKNYLSVRSARPDWNQRVIADRLRDCDRQIAELKRLLAENSASVPEVVAPPSAPSPRPVAPSPSRPAANTAGRSSVPQKTGAIFDDSGPTVNVSVSELAKLRREVIELRLNNQKMDKELQKQRNFENEVSSLLRDRKIAADKYALLEKRFQALQSASKQPEERLAALEQRMVTERMNTRRLEKELDSVSKQLKVEKDNARLNFLAKKALEDILLKRNEELRRINGELSAAAEKLQSASEDKAQYDILARKQKSLLEEVARYSGELADIRKKEQDLLEKLTGSREDNRMLQRANADLQSQLTAFRRSVDELKNSGAAKDELLEKLQREKRDLQNKLNEKTVLAVSAKDKEFADKLLELTRKNGAAQEELIAGKKREDELAQELKRLQSELKTGKNEINRLNELQSGQQQMLDREKKNVAGLQEKISGLEKNIHQLHQEKRELSDKCAVLQGQSDAVSGELMAAQNKNLALETENRNLQLNLTREKNNASISAAELSGLRERNHSLEEDVKQLYARAGELEKRLATRDSADFRAAAAARDSMKKLENDLMNAQTGLAALRSQLDAGKNALAESERKLKAVNDENLKARAEVVEALEKEKQLQRELNSLQHIKNQYIILQRNFNALAAENRENRSLAEAAKPRQAELERAKLRLLENDNLKQALAREQQLNAELKSAYTRDQDELDKLRKRAEEFDAARRKLVELEARAKEAERLQQVEKELAVLREREVELAALKIRVSEISAELRQSQSEKESAVNDKKQLTAANDTLRQENEKLQKLQRINQELEAMLNSQNAELKQANEQLSRIRNEGKKDLHAACRSEAEKLRLAAGKVGELNDRIHLLQDELARNKSNIARVQENEKKLYQQISLKDSELTQLRKLNSELADLRKKSAEALLDQVDSARVTRLEDEISALNKLNAELAAERDKLIAEAANRNQSAEKNVKRPRESSRSPEELAGAGFVAEKEQKTELAIWNYRQAIAANREFTLAHYRLGMILYRRGSFEEAADHLGFATAAIPGNLQLAIDTARCYIAIARFGNAKTIIDPLLEKYPENAALLTCAALIDAGCGAPARAEEKLLSAARLAPESADIQLQLSKLLTSSISDRRREAVIFYEKARSLGAPPEPELEKNLGDMLDHRRELVRFMSSAAREAGAGGDWRSAAWYYKKIVDENHPGYLPLLAFAQWKAGNISAAKETLEFNTPSRNAMVVKTLIALAEKDEESAIRAAQQSAGAVIPAQWVSVNLELEKLKKLSRPSAAVKLLLKSVKFLGSEADGKSN
ncbi:MAG: tetratricopeptide repeat protein [Lentisphaerae bacterium]|nr:tetratricopeptide repeat protein [Lentisphaerota bacterium]